MKATKNQSRVLILVSNQQLQNNYCLQIANKLDLSYCYINRILSRLQARGWMSSEKPRKKRYYALTPDCPIESIKMLYANGEI